MTTKIDIKQTAEILTEKNNIVLLCHKNPDGDTLGSAAALRHVLIGMGKKCGVLCHNKIPPKYDYLNIPLYNGQFEQGYVVAVDVAGAHLLGENLADYAGCVDLCIDHHGSNGNYSKLLCLHGDYPAAAQLVYEIIEAMEQPITAHIADCLYTGMITDTGCFRYSSTTAKTHIIGAKLMELGADHIGLVEKFFMTKTKKTVELEKYALNNLEYHFDGKCALLCLTADVLGEIQPEPTDIDGIVSMARDFEGVDVSVMIKQIKEGVYKLSVRTGESVDACAIARGLGGGGHVRAAGCEVEGSLETAKKAILREVEMRICR